jgi:hypothetical protein
MKRRLDTNDTVRLSGNPQLWRVVNTINGNKADIQRLDDYNLRIITVRLDDVQVVRHFASPEELSTAR